jgi:hypothetical protein
MDVPVAFAVNLREHLWKSLDEFREAIEPMLGLATVMKGPSKLAKMPSPSGYIK